MPACFNDPIFGQTLRCDPGGSDVGTISATAACSSILGGPFATPGTHTNNADLSAIVMGHTNSINIFTMQPPDNGIYNLITNGGSNTVAGCHATIVNGMDNNVCGLYNHIGNGTGNVVSIFATGPDVHTCYSYIGNGYVNKTCANFSTIVNGRYNLANTDHAAVVNGINNNATGVLSFIGNGGDNNITNANFATSSYSFIGNGSKHNANGAYSFIGNGFANTVSVNGDYSFIGNGRGNSIDGVSAVITGGSTNSINNLSNASFIGGGTSNTIANTAPSHCPSTNSFIGGGANNIIDTNNSSGSFMNSIVGGCQNTIHPGTTFGVISGGFSNNLHGTQNGIGSGFSNLVCGEYSFIGGGAINCIATTALPSCVVGRNGILTGYCNEILGQTLFSSITSGGENQINNSCSSFIGSGDYNFIKSIAGGPSVICRSFIGGGVANCIFENTAVIAGGECNVINAGGSCSFIGGGAHNIVSGNFSSIIGGNNNNDGGYNCVGIFGQSIVAVANGHFHINNLWISPSSYNTYLGIAPFGTFPNGTVYVDTSAGNLLRIQ